LSEDARGRWARELGLTSKNGACMLRHEGLNRGVIPMCTRSFLFVTVVFLLAFLSSQVLCAEWFVDGSAAGSGDGTTWESAFRTIQEGIDAAKTTAYYKEHWRYPVRPHLLVGSSKTSGLTPTEVASIMKAVSTIWSQAGVTFQILPVRTYTLGSDALLEVDDKGMYTAAGPGETGKVTSACYTDDAIDVIFVHSFEDRYQGGTTIIPDPPGPDEVYGKPGCIIAGHPGWFKSNMSGELRVNHITRTVAHEFGHYLKNMSDQDAHMNDSTYVMYSSADANKREISKNEADEIRASGVEPLDTNP
jgi:hypothetical protein